MRRFSVHELMIFDGWESPMESVTYRKAGPDSRVLPVRRARTQGWAWQVCLGPIVQASGLTPRSCRRAARLAEAAARNLAAL